MDIHDADVVDVFSFLLGADGSESELEGGRPRDDPRQGQLGGSPLARSACAPAARSSWWSRTSSGSTRRPGSCWRSLPQFVHRCPGASHRDHPPRIRRLAGRLRIGTIIACGRSTARKRDWRSPPCGRKASRPRSPELLDVMERVTGGVPLFIEEICQWMAENAASATDRLAQTASPSHASMFESVLDAQARAAGSAREVARAAAVAGNRFNQQLLRELLPELDDEIIANALDALSEAGFLIARQALRRSGLRRSVMRLIQETIYNATAAQETTGPAPASVRCREPKPRISPAWMGTAALAEHAERAGLAGRRDRAVRDRRHGKLGALGDGRSASSPRTCARALRARSATPASRTRCGFPQWRRSARS